MSETRNIFTAHQDDLVALFTHLIPTIEDDFRASDDPEDNEPGMQVTVSTNEDVSEWSYQTGDNSYSGTCYFHPHWAVVYLYRDSSPVEMAKDVAAQWAESINQ